MKIQAWLLLSVASLAWGQLQRIPPNRDAPPVNVPFQRILDAGREPQNWLTYSGGYMSQRHSGLTQIAPDNAKDLVLKWVFQSKTIENMEVTPLVVDGVMYTVQGINDVFAIDAATGKTFWRYLYKPDAAARNCCGQETRGLAIADGRIFLSALDTTMIAIDAKTGKELWKTQVGDPKQRYSMTHAPLVVKDKVIQGVAGGEFGIRGYITALDVTTGKEAWR